MKNASRFQKGSAVYRCRVCKHNTRDTGGDGAGVQLCDLCFEMAGEDNHVSDYGKLSHSAESVRGELAALDARNGPGTARKCFPDVCDAASYEMPATAPEAVTEEARTIDLTPSWFAVLSIYIAVLENGTEEGKKLARAELARMAQAADKFNASAK